MAHASWETTFISQLKNGSVLVEDSNGKTLLEYRSKDLFMPASAIKILTAACALEKLGPDFRFETEFYAIPGGHLGIKGYGDPLLVSEELAVVAEKIKEIGVPKIQDIILDHGYFAPSIRIDGASRSTNPYDAVNSALLVNFNTLNFKKLSNGKVVSLEPQTPLTPMTLKKAQGFKAGTYRINLGGDADTAALFFGGILQAFLQEQGIPVSGVLRVEAIPESAKLFYTHRSSKSLAEVLTGMLEFSTNLTTNQIFLAMGAKQFGAPATVEKGLQILNQFVAEKLGWQGYHLGEASGLSRKTSVTAEQMMGLLRYFEPHRDLLPLKEKIFRAKTGSINGVNTLAGYYQSPRNGLVRFVILVNDTVPFDYRFRLAKQLVERY